MMNEEVDRLRQQVQEIAGRLIADGAMLRQSVLNHSTIELRNIHSLLEKLGDESGVRNQLRGCTPGTLKAFEEQRKAWGTLIQQEIDSRDAATGV